jgi:hypothetical protein
VEVQEVEADRKMQEVEVGTGRLVGRGGSSTGLARARVRSWGNGEQQQDDGRVGKGLASMGVLVCSRR